MADGVAAGLRWRAGLRSEVGHGLDARNAAAPAARLGASPRQVALAWLLQHSPTILLIPGTSSLAHLRENIAAANIELPADAAKGLDRIGTR